MLQLSVNKDSQVASNINLELFNKLGQWLRYLDANCYLETFIKAYNSDLISDLLANCPTNSVLLIYGEPLLTGAPEQFNEKQFCCQVSRAIEPT